MKHTPFFTNIIKYEQLPLYLFKQELQKSLYELMLHNRQQKYFVNSISALITQTQWVTVYTNQLTTISSDGVGDFLLDTRLCEKELHIIHHLAIWDSNHCHSESTFDGYNIKYSGFRLTEAAVYLGQILENKNKSRIWPEWHTCDHYVISGSLTQSAQMNT
jgi:hypothetical protein